jgi:LysM repeat protein
MNPPSPLFPKGSFMGRQTARRRSKLRTVLLCVLVFHVVLLGGWLIQGCRHRQVEVASSESPQANGARITGTNTAVQPSRPETNRSTPFQPVAFKTAPVSDVPTASEPPSIPTPRAYRVARGDTLAKIAQRTGVSQNALSQANPGVQSAKLRVGQWLRIPNGSPVAVPMKRSTNAAGGDGQPPVGDALYTVKSGDTLSKVAQTHGISISALRTLNGLSSDQLLVGKTLKLPAPTASVENSSGRAVSTTSSNRPAQP